MTLEHEQNLKRFFHRMDKKYSYYFGSMANKAKSAEECFVELNKAALFYKEASELDEKIKNEILAEYDMLFNG